MTTVNNAICIEVAESTRAFATLTVYAEPATAALTAQRLSALLGEHHYVLVSSSARIWLRYDNGRCTQSYKWADFYLTSLETRDDERAVDILLQNARLTPA